MEYDKEFKVRIMALHFRKNDRKKGTTVTFQCDEKVLNETKNLFTQFSDITKVVDTNIYFPAGFLFVNQVQIQRINGFYSYNLENKDLLTRDRTSIDLDTAAKDIAKILSFAGNKKVCEAYLRRWKENSAYIEYREKLNFRVIKKTVWTKALEKVFTRKTCLSSDSIEHSLAAIDNGYQVLSNCPENVALLLRYLGMRYDKEVATVRADAKIVKKQGSIKSLTKQEKAVLDMIMKMYEFLYGKDAAQKVVLVEEFNEDSMGPDAMGAYFGIEDTVYIHRNALNYGKAMSGSGKHVKIPGLENLLKTDPDFYLIAYAAGVLIHENVHRTSKASDRTREFENALSMELGMLVTVLYSSITKKQPSTSNVLPFKQRKISNPNKNMGSGQICQGKLTFS